LSTHFFDFFYKLFHTPAPAPCVIIYYMEILTQKIPRSSLKNRQFIMGDEMVKGVVDLKQNLLAIDAELHSDLEKLLLENGSAQSDLWGINLYLDGELVEFDSMINIRPAENNRSRFVENPEIREKILALVEKWIDND